MDPLAHRLRNLTAAADALWDASAARCLPGELFCRGGCIGCCTGLFAIGTAEALLVRDAVSSLVPSERELVRGAAGEIRRLTARRFPGDPETGILDGERPGEVERFVAETHAIPCPLLDLSGRCRIYASRPLTCRTYGLALVEENDVASAPCALNFVGVGSARPLETGIALSAVRRIEREMDAAVVTAGWDPSAETTIAHAIAGSAFAG